MFRLSAPPTVALAFVAALACGYPGAARADISDADKQDIDTLVEIGGDDYQEGIDTILEEARVRAEHEAAEKEKKEAGRDPGSAHGGKLDYT